MLDAALEKAILERVVAIPIVDTLGMQVLELEPGLCRIKVARKPAYDGVFESFHGGLLMTVADSAACFAILTHTGPQVKLTTTDMNIRFLAPCFHRSDRGRPHHQGGAHHVPGFGGAVRRCRGLGGRGSGELHFVDLVK